MISAARPWEEEFNEAAARRYLVGSALSFIVALHRHGVGLRPWISDTGSGRRETSELGRMGDLVLAKTAIPVTRPSQPIARQVARGFLPVRRWDPNRYNALTAEDPPRCLALRHHREHYVGERRSGMQVMAAAQCERAQVIRPCSCGRWGSADLPPAASLPDEKDRTTLRAWPRRVRLPPSSRTAASKIPVLRLIRVSCWISHANQRLA